MDEYRKIFSRNLQRLMKKHEINQVALANKLGISQSVVSSWITGARYPRMNTVEKLAALFHIEKSDLIEDKSHSEEEELPDGAYIPRFKKVPMYGYAAAGLPLEDVNQEIAYADIEDSYDVDFCMTVRGDSMIGADIHDGDIVFIKYTTDIPNGRIACMRIDGDKLCLKRFYRTKEGITLLSENPKYEPILLTPRTHPDIQIMGIAVVKQSKV